MKKILAAAFLLVISSAHAAQEPDVVFNRSCAMCHNGQLPIAPKKGDQAAWKPRLDKGPDVLLKKVTEGLNVMPPRGLCMDCSPEDLAAVIAWISK